MEILRIKMEPDTTNRTMVRNSVVCLVCDNKIDTEQANIEDCLGEECSNLFQVFSNYMQWEPGESPDQQFQFQTEIFPFCSSCKSVLSRIHGFDETIRVLLGQIDDLITHLSTKIVLSQRKRSYSKDSFRNGDSSNNEAVQIVNFKNGGQAFYNSQKVGFYRELILNQKDPNIDQSSKSSENEEIIDQEEDEEIETLPLVPETCLVTTELDDVSEEKLSLERLRSPNGTPQGHSNGEANFKNFTDLEICVLEDEPHSSSNGAALTAEFFKQKHLDRMDNIKRGRAKQSIGHLFRGRIKDRIVRLGPHKFLFDGKVEFELNSANKWVCGSCGHAFLKRFHLENHLLAGCKACSRNTKCAAEQVDEKTFQYRKFTYHLLDDGHLKCSHCLYTSYSKHNTELHIRRVHESKTASEKRKITSRMGPNIFGYGGWTYRKENNGGGNLKCGSCEYVTPFRGLMTQHIRNTHMSGKGSLETNPNIHVIELDMDEDMSKHGVDPEEEELVEHVVLDDDFQDETELDAEAAPLVIDVSDDIDPSKKTDSSIEKSEKNILERKAAMKVRELLGRVLLKGRVENLGNLKFLYNGPHGSRPFELNSEHKWVCLKCAKEFRHAVNMELHFRVVCRPVIVEAATNSGKSRKTTTVEAVAPSSPSEDYVRVHTYHDDFTFEEDKDGVLKCSHCSYKSAGRRRKRNIQQHIRFSHELAQPASPSVAASRASLTVRHLFKGRIKDRITQLGERSFLFDNKVWFELSARNNRWSCKACGHEYMKRFFLENHLISGCKGVLKQPDPTTELLNGDGGANNNLLFISPVETDDQIVTPAPDHSIGGVVQENQVQFYMAKPESELVVSDSVYESSSSSADSRDPSSFNIQIVSVTGATEPPSEMTLTGRSNKPRGSTYTSSATTTVSKGWSPAELQTFAGASSREELTATRDECLALSRVEKLVRSAAWQGRIRQLGPRTLIFDEKYPFELSTNNKWTCLTCNHAFSGRYALVDRHLVLGCKGAFRKPILQINETEFVHRGYVFELGSDNKFQCQTCGYDDFSKAKMAKHIYQVHVGAAAVGSSESPDLDFYAQMEGGEDSVELIPIVTGTSSGTVQEPFGQNQSSRNATSTVPGRADGGGIQPYSYVDFPDEEVEYEFVEGDDEYQVEAMEYSILP